MIPPRMISPRLLSHLPYLAVGVVSLLVAVFLASKIVRSSFSQEQLTEETAESAPPAANAPADAPPSAAGQDSAAAEASDAGTPVVEAAGVELASDKNNLVFSDSVPFLEPYIFDTRDGRRNPFRPPVQSDGTTADVLFPGTPLERFEIEELKLVGIMWDIKNPKAMVVDPQGEVYILSKDDRVGRKRGYVAVIREGEVVIVETTTFNNETAYSTRVMRIEK